MYIVVEIDPETGDHHVLFPRESLAQVHATWQAAERHRTRYIEAVYEEDPWTGEERVRTYRLELTL